MGGFFTFKKGLKENRYLFFWSGKIIVQGLDTSDCCSLFAIKELAIDFKMAEHSRSNDDMLSSLY